ncbi:MAG: glycine cleavage system protein T, partial [Gemmatimonadetes bacterium]|nr:glycine cleavage system protein T [Gemmatimonadota bacterium]
GRGWQVDLGQAGDFIGREALARIAAEGPKRKLAGVEIGGEPLDLNMTRWPVHKGGEQIGFVTSAVYSPRLGRNIGYAMVPAPLAALGTRLSVTTPDGERDATVVPRPFVDPDKEIPKS